MFQINIFDDRRYYIKLYLFDNIFQQYFVESISRQIIKEYFGNGFQKKQKLTSYGKKFKYDILYVTDTIL